MNSQMMDFTLAGKCGNLSASGSTGLGAAFASSCIMLANAIDPKPRPACCKNLRRTGRPKLSNGNSNIFNSHCDSLCKLNRCTQIR